MERELTYPLWKNPNNAELINKKYAHLGCNPI